MNKRKVTRLALLLFLVGLIVLVIGVAISHPAPAQPPQGRAQSTPTTHPTTMPTVQPTSTPVIVPTTRPTATAQPVVVPTAVPTKAPVVVLSNAQLGSTLASFKAKYGQDAPQSTGITAFVSSPGLQEGSLTVTYNTYGVVTYIVYAGPDNWTQKQYAAMMLTWIPSDAVVVTSTTDLNTYKSVSIGNFDEQFTGVVAGVYKRVRRLRMTEEEGQ